MLDWINAKSIAQVVRAATMFGPRHPAEVIGIELSEAYALPPIDGLRGIELLEAMFLEDREPIAIFDAEQAELISVRILTALWPGLRRSFSLSTFARAPRALEERSFDLVFAPKDARSRFADWSGRRIDGSKVNRERHRWSSIIRDRVFVAPLPSLRGLDVLGAMSGDETGSETVLRVSLLWEELQAKVASSPNAALGLIDIANSRSVGREAILGTLEPMLASVTERVTTSMPSSSAWQFAIAMMDKLYDYRASPDFVGTVRASLVGLAASDQVEAIREASNLSASRQPEFMLAAAGDGVAKALDGRAIGDLWAADEKVALRLILASPALAARLLMEYPEISGVVASALEQATEHDRMSAKAQLLPLVTRDEHAPIARVLFNTLNNAELVEECAFLFQQNQLGSRELRQLIVQRARGSGNVSDLREAASQWASISDEAYAIVTDLVNPSAEDVRWLLTTPHLSMDRRFDALNGLVSRANKDELRSMLADQVICGQAMRTLAGQSELGGASILRIANEAGPPSGALIDVAMSVIPALDDRSSGALAALALEALLQSEDVEQPLDALERLLDIALARQSYSVTKAIRTGLQRSLSSRLASRNILAFERTRPYVRIEFLRAIETIAACLVERGRLDLSGEAYEAAARLLWDAQDRFSSFQVRAASALLPILLQSPTQPVSPLVAAAFPPVYIELGKESPPEFAAFIFMFLDWDRCKTARRNLVSAFMASSWRPSDIALAAVRSNDALRIFRRLSRQYGGDRAIEAIKNDLPQVPLPWQADVKRALEDLESRRTLTDEWDY